MIVQKVLSRLRTYRRIGFLRSARIALDKAALGGLRLLFGFDRWHASSPLSARPYRKGLAALVSDLNPKRVVEVGCGLGAILSRIRADERYGYDIDPRVVRAARFLHGRSVRFFEGGFDEMVETDIDVLIAVNWIHDFSPDQLERWLMRKLPTIRYLLVDAIDPSSPLSYRHYHDFSFLEGAAEPVFAGAFGEEHRRFILYKVGR